MSDRFTRTPKFSKLVVLVILVGATAACANTPATAMADSRSAAELRSAAGVHTLTNDIDAPANGAAAQLPIGVALLTAGLLGLLIGVAAHRNARRSSFALAATSPEWRAGIPTAKARARSPRDRRVWRGR